MFSGLGGMVMSGMAFGAGSEIAHSAIRSITGSGKLSSLKFRENILVIREFTNIFYNILSFSLL